VALLPASHLSDIVPDYAEASAVFRRLGYESITSADAAVIRTVRFVTFPFSSFLLTDVKLAAAVSVRAARLTATACAAVILFAGGDAVKRCANLTRSPPYHQPSAARLLSMAQSSTSTQPSTRS
jgi:hypothetical protein